MTALGFLFFVMAVVFAGARRDSAGEVERYIVGGIAALSAVAMLLGITIWLARVMP